MANLSDAFGDVIIEKVGKEFLEFIYKVQGDDAYYTLVDKYDVKDNVPDKDGDLKFSFGTSGRWAYSNNVEGYLNGTWMGNNEKEKKAYAKFISALKKKNGSVTIEYTDSDTAMDWMGTGVATLSVIDGEVSFHDDFESETITISGYAKLNGDDEHWALEYIYGEEVGEEYDKYVEKWKQEHEYKKGDSEPAGPDEWFTNDYKPEE